MIDGALSSTARRSSSILHEREGRLIEGIDQMDEAKRRHANVLATLESALAVLDSSAYHDDNDDHNHHHHQGNRGQKEEQQ